MRAPTPETRRALLVAEKAHVPTPHVFVEARECVLPSPDGAAWEFIFRCEKTGAERRWGTWHREPTEGN